MALKIEYSQSALNTPAFALIAEGWNALVQEGWTLDDDAIPPISPESRVLYAANDKDGDIVGVVTWTAQKTVATLGIVYVEPSSTHAGVFKALMEAVRERMKMEKIGYIRFQVHAGNQNAQAALRHLDLTPQALVYAMRV
jgi:GNAT superfamily N-acetyltransferase